MLDNMTPEHKQILLSALSPEQRKGLTPTQRVAMGLAPHELGRVQQFAENYLPRWRALRSIFGLDRPFEPEAMFPAGGSGDQEPWNAATWYNSQMQFELDRRSIYQLVEEMDTYDLVGTALDLVGEDSTQPDFEYGRSVWVETKNNKVYDELMEMLDRVGIEDLIFSIARVTCKYGDDFEAIIQQPGEGVVALEFVPPTNITRVQDRYGTLLGFLPGSMYTWQELRDEEFLAKQKPKMSLPWDFLHFRLQSSRREMIHGETFLMNARRTWRQLKIIEDSLVLYRINRAPDRTVYYIDVGQQPQEDAYRTVLRWKQAIRKKFLMDTQAGKMRQEYNPQAIDDNIFWPVRKDSQSRVDTLTGSGPVGDIWDVEYWRDKFFAAVRIPKAYAGFEGDINAKATLSQQDVRFARTVKRVQRSIVIGLTHLCRIHLALKGMEKEAEDPDLFHVRMSPISFLDESQRAELTTMKLEVADKMMDFGDKLPEPAKPRWQRHVLVDYLGYTKKQAVRLVPDEPDEPEEPEGGEKGGEKGEEPPGGKEKGPEGEESSPKVLGSSRMLDKATREKSALVRGLDNLRKTPKVKLDAKSYPVPKKVANSDGQINDGMMDDEHLLDYIQEVEDLDRETATGRGAQLTTMEIQDITEDGFKCPRCEKRGSFVESPTDDGEGYAVCECGFIAGLAGATIAPTPEVREDES